MKFLKSLFLALIISLSISLPTFASAEKPIEVSIDSKNVYFMYPPIIKNGTTLVPFRVVFEELGIHVTWDQKTKTIIGVKDGLSIQLKVDDKLAVVNGKPLTLDVAPEIIYGTTFVPLRFIGESVSADVSWSSEDRHVSIYTILEIKLLHAVVDDDVEKVREILGQGANPNYVTDSGRSLLGSSLESKNGVTRALLEGGADPNTADEEDHGDTLIHLAITFSKPDAVKAFVDAKADLNATNIRGQTPVEHALSSYKESEDKSVQKEILSILGYDVSQLP